MPCAPFEDLLVDYAELGVRDRQTIDAHLAHCMACREFLETLAVLDAGLVDLYTGAQTSPAFQERVLARANGEGPPARPTFLPEILDLIGWVGILVALVCVAPLLLSVSGMSRLTPEFSTIAAVVASLLAILAAIWIGLLSYNELRN
jgi:hypothetical protein